CVPLRWGARTACRSARRTSPCRCRSGRSRSRAPPRMAMRRRRQPRRAARRRLPPRRSRSAVGQKVHPYGFRLGFNKTWRSRWYSDRDYAKLLHEDLALRQDLKTRFSHAGVSRIETERAANKLKIDIYTSRPGIIIGRKGTEVDKLKQEVQKRT